MKTLVFRTRFYNRVEGVSDSNAKWLFRRKDVQYKTPELVVVQSDFYSCTGCGSTGKLSWFDTGSNSTLILRCPSCKRFL